MPLLLRVGKVLAIAGAGFYGLIGVSMSTGCGDNQQVYRAFDSGWGVGFYTASAWVSGILLTAAAIGLRRHATWVPYVSVGFWVWQLASTNLLAIARHASASVSWTVGLAAGIGVVLSALYFLVKPNVRAYYASLKDYP